MKLAWCDFCGQKTPAGTHGRCFICGTAQEPSDDEKEQDCPDHEDCDGNPLTCMVREGEAMGLYEMEDKRLGFDEEADKSG